MTLDALEVFNSIDHLDRTILGEGDEDLVVPSIENSKTRISRSLKRKGRERLTIEKGSIERHDSKR